MPHFARYFNAIRCIALFRSICTPNGVTKSRTCASMGLAIRVKSGDQIKNRSDSLIIQIRPRLLSAHRIESQHKSSLHFKRSINIWQMIIWANINPHVYRNNSATAINDNDEISSVSYISHQRAKCVVNLHTFRLL